MTLYEPSVLTHEVSCVILQDHKFSLPEQNGNNTRRGGMGGWVGGGGVPLDQRFSNFFQVGTNFISQNVLRTTLLLGLSNSLGSALNSVRNMFLQQKIPLLLLRVK